MSLVSSLCANCKQTLSICEYDGISLCDQCNKDFELYAERNTARYVKEFIEKKPIRDFAKDNGLRESLVEDIFDEKFTTMSLDDVLLAVKVLPKMNVYGSIVLIGECFERIFALTKDVKPKGSQT